MMPLDEKLRDHQSYYNSSSEHHGYLRGSCGDISLQKLIAGTRRKDGTAKVGTEPLGTIVQTAECLSKISWKPLL